MSDTKPSEPKQKAYLVGHSKHYRDGRVYEAGELIYRPEGEKPGKDWTEVDSATGKAFGASAEAPKPTEQPKQKRAADRDV